MSVARTLNNLGLLLRAQNEFSEAESLLIESLDIRLAIFNEVHPDVARGYHSLASLYQDMGNFNRSLEYYHQELLVWEAIKNVDSLHIASVKTEIGANLTKLLRFEEAEHILLENYNELASVGESMSEIKRTALEQLIELYLAWNKPAEAEQYQALYSSH